MKATRIQAAALMIITLVAVMIVESNKINCNDPQVWGTQSGVQHCAINGGK